MTYEDVTNVDSIGIITARAGVLVGSGITLSKDGDGFFTGIVTATSYYGDGSNLSNITSTTINSNADNRLITGSGTANTLNGESNLTFDGSTLTVNGDASFTTANGNNIVFDKSGNDLVFGDSVYLRFGAGDDLALAHDGSNSYIQDNGTGDLVIAGSQIRLKSANTLEDMLKATENGAVTLYYDNDEKLSTGSVGLYAKSIMPSSHATYDIGQNMGRWNDIYIADNGKLKIGQDNDLQIFHDGSDSFIKDTGTGALKVCSNLFRVNNAANDEAMIKAEEDAGVTLSFNGSTKFETTSTGVTITGNILAAGTNADIKIEAVGAGGHVKFRTTGSDRWYVEGTNGHFLPQADNTYDIGNSTYRVRNVYTTDLQLSNEGKTNDVDGTWGNYTIQEGESDLFLINNRSGKKYKFNLTEVS